MFFEELYLKIFPSKYLYLNSKKQLQPSLTPLAAIDNMIMRYAIIFF